MKNLTFEQKRTLRKLKSYFYITIAAFCFTFTVNIFARGAKIVTPGLSSIGIVITYVSPLLSQYMSLIYLAINIPFIIFSYYKNTKKFTVRTTYFLITQALFGLMFLNPNVEVRILDELMGLNNSEYVELIWPLFVLAWIGATSAGAIQALLWKSGSSTGGSDFIIIYFSKKYKKSLGGIGFSIGMVFMAISLIINGLLNDIFAEHWFVLVIISIAYLFTTQMLTNRIYPKYSVVSITIASEKEKEIEKYLRSDEFPHAFEMRKVSSRYKENRILFNTNILLLRQRKLVSELKKIDESVWISSSKVHKIFGKYKYDDDDHAWRPQKKKK